MQASNVRNHIVRLLFRAQELTPVPDWNECYCGQVRPRLFHQPVSDVLLSRLPFFLRFLSHYLRLLLLDPVVRPPVPEIRQLLPVSST